MLFKATTLQLLILSIKNLFIVTEKAAFAFFFKKITKIYR